MGYYIIIVFCGVEYSDRKVLDKIMTSILNKNSIHISLIVVLAMSAFFIFSEKAHAETLISGNISGDEHWTEAKSPIIIDGSIRMENGSNLTIDPGVVVKFKRNAEFLEGEGKIIAIGTDNNPIIFTSFFDDTGGDSNPDGDGSHPKMGDWGRINLSNPDSQISHVEFRYGMRCLELNGPIVISNIKVSLCVYGIVADTLFRNSIQNSEIIYNYYGMYIATSMVETVKNNLIARNTYGFWHSGTPFATDVSNNDIFENDYGITTDYTRVVFRNNNIYNNKYSGFEKSGYFDANAINNWWGDASGPENSTSNPEGLGNRVTDKVNFNPWAREKINNTAPVPSRPTLRLTANPTLVDYKGSSTIKWIAVDATSCDIDGRSVITGSFSTGSLSTTTTYSGTCTGLGGTSPEASVTVTVKESKPKEPVGLRPVIIIPGIMGSELYDGSDFIWPNVDLLLDRVHDYFLLESLSMDENGNSIKDISLGDIVKEIKIPVANKTLTDIFNGLIVKLESKNYVLNNNYFLFPYDWRLNLDNSIDSLKNKIDAIKKQTGFFKVDIVAHSMGGLLTEDYINQFGSDSINKLIFVGTPHLGAPKSAKVLLEGDTEIPAGVLNKETIKKLSLNSPSIYQLLPSQKYFDTYQGYIELHGASLDLLPYNSTRLFLKNQKLNFGLIDKAEEFFSKSLDEVDYGSAKVYNIAGCALATQASYSFSSQKNHITSTGYISGDGTVPLTSAEYVSTGANSKYYAKGVKHSEMPSNSAIRELILGILKDSVVSNSNISNSSNFCNFQGKQLTWKSPVEVHIYDQLGNHAGPTNDGGFENNLIGVDYEIIDGEKFIYIPSDDGNTYTIEGSGEATGTFDLVISDIDNGNVASSVVYNDVAITKDSQVTVDVSNAQAQVQFDSVGDGNFIALESDATLTGSDVNDRTPPSTSASETGSSIGPKQITLEAVDDGSGVLSIKYSLDGSSFHTYNSPISISEIGTHTIYFYAVDKAGNNEETKTVSVIIYSAPSGDGGYYSPPVVSEIPKEEGQILGETKTVTIRDSTLVLDTTDGRTVYIIGNNGKKFGFISEQVFLGLGYAFANVITADLSNFGLGGLVESANAAHPSGSLVINNGIIWYINNGLRSGFPSMEIFNSLGFDLNQVVSANDYDLKLEEQIIN